MNTPRKRPTSFDDFVERQQIGQTKDDAAFWKGELHDWLAYLQKLYSTVEEHLKPYVESGTIKINYRNITLNEDHIGRYEASEMLVNIGRQEVVFTPVGTVLIGTKGRVDVEGTAGKARLILTDRNASGPQIKTTLQRGDYLDTSKPEKNVDIEWTWKIATHPPQVSYVDLTKETLFDLVMEVANG